jgi:predicted SAM-dependent methyltransferase
MRRKTRSVPPLDVHPWYDRYGTSARGLRKFLRRIMPMHAYIHVRKEIPLIFVRWKGRSVRRSFRSRDNLLVNLGAGPEGKRGWVNLDVDKAPGVNCVYDCRKSLPFSDASVKGIFCEHFFEHIDYTEEVPYFLSECHRVLKTGAVLRLIVPDAEMYLRAYCNGGWKELTGIRPLHAEHKDSYWGCEYNTPMELINEVFRQGHEHKFAYDFETLRFLLLRYGFSEVVRQEYGRSLLTELCLDQAVRSSESLYVEGRK